MRFLALLLVLLLVACGGSAATKPVAPPPVVEAPLDPPCPTTAKFTPAGGEQSFEYALLTRT